MFNATLPANQVGSPTKKSTTKRKMGRREQYLSHFAWMVHTLVCVLCPLLMLLDGQADDGSWSGKGTLAYALTLAFVGFVTFSLNISVALRGDQAWKIGNICFTVLMVGLSAASAILLSRYSVVLDLNDAFARPWIAECPVDGATYNANQSYPAAVLFMDPDRWVTSRANTTTLWRYGKNSKTQVGTVYTATYTGKLYGAACSDDVKGKVILVPPVISLIVAVDVSDSVPRDAASVKLRTVLDSRRFNTDPIHSQEDAYRATTRWTVDSRPLVVAKVALDFPTQSTLGFYAVVTCIMCVMGFIIPIVRAINTCLSPVILKEDEKREGEAGV